MIDIMTNNNIVPGKWPPLPNHAEPVDINNSLNREGKTEAQFGSDKKRLGIINEKLALAKGLSVETPKILTEFEKIYNTALLSNPLESSVQEALKILQGSPIDELLKFAENSSNHAELMEKPALVVALYRLLVNEF